MKLISNKLAKSFEPQSSATTALAMEAYGSPSQLVERLQPGTTEVCPYTTAAMVAAFSPSAIAQVITPYVAQTVAILGNDNTDPAVVKTVSMAIARCDDNHVRLLNFSRLLGFFSKVLQGSYKLYGITHAAVMEAFQDYCRVEYERQLAAERQHKSEEEQRQWEQHLEKSLSWQEYAKLKGLDPDKSPLDYVNQ